MVQNNQPNNTNYTKFEKARIIGARALQLSMGAPFMIPLSKEDLEKLRFNTLEIAIKEFNALKQLTLPNPISTLFPGKFTGSSL